MAFPSCYRLRHGRLMPTAHRHHEGRNRTKASGNADAQSGQCFAVKGLKSPSAIPDGKPASTFPGVAPEGAPADRAAQTSRPGAACGVSVLEGFDGRGLFKR